MRLSMSFSTRRELLARVAPRYREASRQQKTVILNEFIASTGYKRKYAIRLLSLPEIPAPRKIERPRSDHFQRSELLYFCLPKLMHFYLPRLLHFYLPKLL